MSQILGNTDVNKSEPYLTDVTRLEKMVGLVRVLLTDASFNGSTSFVCTGERPFKTSNNSILNFQS